MELSKGFKCITLNQHNVITPPQVETLIAQSCQYLNEAVRKSLKTAILEGPIGTEIGAIKVKDRPQGSFIPRIQSWMWKNHGCQFSTEVETLNKAFAVATSNDLPSEMYVGFDRSFYWRAGDFGDPGSCYWGGNRKARYWMRNEPRSYAFIVYKTTSFGGTPRQNFMSQKYATCDGKQLQGFGRCLLLVDFPEPGLISVYNTYPSTQLSSKFVDLIGQALGWDKTHSLRIELRNDGAGNGWFYTNNRDSYAIAPDPNLLKNLKGMYDIKAGNPSMKNFPDFLGLDNGYEVMTDDPHILVDFNIFGSPSKHFYSQTSLQNITECRKCKQSIIVGRDQEEILSEKRVRNQDGDTFRYCAECFIEHIVMKEDTHKHFSERDFYSPARIKDLSNRCTDSHIKRIRELYASTPFARLKKQVDGYFPPVELELHKEL